MRLTLICIGRAKAGADRDLALRYIERARAAGRPIGLTIECREIDESRGRRPEDRKDEESKAIVARLGPGDQIIALDETGQAMSSMMFAGLVRRARDTGIGGLAVVIGGPDGLDPGFRQSATHVVAFGAMTWPHQLVRIMASEQIYRAVTIITGHPYHRA